MQSPPLPRLAASVRSPGTKQTAERRYKWTPALCSKGGKGRWGGGGEGVFRTSSRKSITVKPGVQNIDSNGAQEN